MHPYICGHALYHLQRVSLYLSLINIEADDKVDGMEQDSRDRANGESRVYMGMDPSPFSSNLHEQLLLKSEP